MGQGRQAGRQDRLTVRERFDRLCRRHAAEWRMLACKQAGSRDLGNDVFGEAIRRVVQRLDELDHIESSYVRTAIRSVAADFRKKARTRREGRTRAAIEAEVHRPRPERPDEYAVRAEWLERVHRAMRQLSEEHRDVIELTELEGMTQNEAASELELDRKTLRKRRNGALEILRDIIEPVGDGAE